MKKNYGLISATLVLMACGSGMQAASRRLASGQSQATRQMQPIHSANELIAAFNRSDKGVAAFLDNLFQEKGYGQRQSIKGTKFREFMNNAQITTLVRLYEGITKALRKAVDEGGLTRFRQAAEDLLAEVSPALKMTPWFVQAQKSWSAAVDAGQANIARLQAQAADEANRSAESARLAQLAEAEAEAAKLASEEAARLALEAAAESVRLASATAIKEKADEKLKEGAEKVFEKDLSNLTSKKNGIAERFKQSKETYNKNKADLVKASSERCESFEKWKQYTALKERVNVQSRAWNTDIQKDLTKTQENIDQEKKKLAKAYTKARGWTGGKAATATVALGGFFAATKALEAAGVDVAKLLGNKLGDAGNAAVVGGALGATIVTMAAFYHWFMTPKETLEMKQLSENQKAAEAILKDLVEFQKELKGDQELMASREALTSATKELNKAKVEIDVQFGKVDKLVKNPNEKENFEKECATLTQLESSFNESIQKYAQASAGWWQSVTTFASNNTGKLVGGLAVLGVGAALYYDLGGSKTFVVGKGQKAVDEIKGLFAKGPESPSSPASPAPAAPALQPEAQAPNVSVGSGSQISQALATDINNLISASEALQGDNKQLVNLPSSLLEELNKANDIIAKQAQDALTQATKILTVQEAAEQLVKVSTAAAAGAAAGAAKEAGEGLNAAVKVVAQELLEKAQAAGEVGQAARALVIQKGNETLQKGLQELQKGLQEGLARAQEAGKEGSFLREVAERYLNDFEVVSVVEQ